MISGVATAVSSSQIYTIRATSPSQCSVTQTLRLRITGTDPIRSTLGVNRTQYPVGTSPDTTVMLTLLDSNGQPVVGNQVALTSNRPQDVITATGGSVTDVNGVATFTLHSTLSGTSTLTAVDVTDLETLSTIGQMEFTPGAAVRLAAIGIPNAIVAGLELAAEIQAVEAYGNRDTGFTGLVRVSHNDGGTQSAGAGPLSLNLVNGKADYAIKLTRAQATTISAQHLPASGPALTSEAWNVQISPGRLDPAHTQIIPDATTLTAGQDYAFEIEPQDAYGNSNPSEPADAADLSWITEASSDGSIQPGPLTWSHVRKRFLSTVQGWTAGRLDVRISIRGGEGPAQILTVNPGQIHHLSLENLPENIQAGVPMAGLALTGFDVAGNQTDPGSLFLSTYVDKNCKIPTPGIPADNTNLPSLHYDPGTKTATFDPFKIYSSKTLTVGIQAAVPFCSAPINVVPAAISNTQSYVTFDHFPFSGDSESRTKTYPTSKPAPMRVVVRDAFQNPIPDAQVQITQGSLNRLSYFATLDPKNGSWTDIARGVDSISVKTDEDGIGRFQVWSGETPDEVTLNSTFDGVTPFGPASIRFQDGVENLNTGNLFRTGLVTVGHEPTPLVLPVDTPSPPAPNPAWMVAVQLTSPDTLSSTIICPGVLMNWTHVLAPASCLIERGRGAGDTLEIQAGSYWDSSVSTAYRQIRTVKRIKLDPSYTPSTPVSDLAILEVNTPFTANAFVSLAVLKAGSIEGLPVTAYSWHQTENYMPYSIPYYTRASLFLRVSDELMTQNRYTQSGITHGSEVFNMNYLTLGRAHTATSSDLVTTGQYTVIAGDHNEFLGFTVAGGDFREPHTERLTVDTAIQVESTHPFIFSLLIR